MTNSEARKRRAEALAVQHEPIDEWFRHIGTTLSNEDYETGISVIARLTTERDEAVAEVRDYRRALGIGIACTSCARTLEDMHALEAQVAALEAVVAAVAELADQWEANCVDALAFLGEFVDVRNHRDYPKIRNLRAALTDPATILARRDAEVAARALREAADEMEAVIADGDCAEVAAPVAGEVGRGTVVARRDALYEEPQTWLREYAARIARAGGAS